MSSIRESTIHGREGPEIYWRKHCSWERKTTQTNWLLTYITCSCSLSKKKKEKGPNLKTVFSLPLVWLAL